MKIKTMVRCAIASVTVAFALVPVVARACDHGNGMAHGAQAYGPHAYGPQVYGTQAYGAPAGDHAGCGHAHHAHHHHGVNVVYGTPAAVPAYVVLPPPRYVVNQGPVLGGPGLDPAPHVVYGAPRGHHHHSMHAYGEGSAHPHGHGHHDYRGYGQHVGYDGYDGGPYAQPMRHTVDPTRGPGPIIITLPAPRAYHMPRRHSHKYRMRHRARMIYTQLHDVQH